MDQPPDPISRPSRDAQPATPARARVADERAEIVELSVVGPSRTSRIQVLVVAAGGLAILAVALAGLAAPLTEDPTASAAAVLSSASPDATLGGLTPRPSARPPATAPPSPTPRPGQWAATVVPAIDGEFSVVESIWALPDVVIANVVSHSSNAEPAYSLVASADGLDWRVTAGPPGLVVRAGTVHESRLWIIGRRGEPAAPSWEIWSTADGSNWRQMSGVRGLPDEWPEVTRLVAGPLGWMMVGYVEVHDPGGDVRARFEVRYARDGSRWRPVEVPGAESQYWVLGVASDRDRWVIGGVGPAPGRDEQPVVTTAWVSADAESWAARVVATMNGSASALTWGPQGFVLVGTEWLDPGPQPRAWVSGDGLSWAYMGIEPGIRAASTGMVQVAGTPRGYLAIGEASEAWLSADGATWLPIDVLPRATDVFASSIAIRDDLVLVGTGSDGEPIIWRGDLGTLP